MCGIICEICYTGKSIIQQDDKIIRNVKNRGPDCNHSLEIHLDDGVTLFFYGAVLWMQGFEPTVQPVESNIGILLYNGDIFDEYWDSEESDTKQIMEKLGSASKISSDEIIKELKTFKGPFSLVFYNKLTQDLYFTRDKLGRNSMLLHNDKNSVIISSVLDRKYQCIEVPASHINVLNVKYNTVKRISWNSELSDEKKFDDWAKTIREQQSLPDDEFIFHFDDNSEEEDSIVSYIKDIANTTNCKLNVMEKLMENNVIKETVLQTIKLLGKSIQMRLKRQPNKCKQCLVDNNSICSHCTVGILFSGGLDCTILAFMANKYLPANQHIDLINVAFKKDNDNDLSYDVPDRQTGKKSLQELQKLCPMRKWVLKEVNVPRSELEKMQALIIADLVYPRQTILDESLGSALWFAAKGDAENDTTSSCRILLLGSGADELFGGYTRHRNAYKRKGWSGLRKELLLDWSRISYRNLARDNRVICDHGRQPRLPYLDEDFTKFVLELKPWLKCFPTEKLENGIGDKLMLRLVAYELGLLGVAVFPKRALQFGSRIANKKEKGSDISKTFLNKVELN